MRQGHGGPGERGLQGAHGPLQGELQWLNDGGMGVFSVGDVEVC